MYCQKCIPLVLCLTTQLFLFSINMNVLFLSLCLLPVYFLPSPINHHMTTQIYPVTL